MARRPKVILTSRGHRVRSLYEKRVLDEAIERGIDFEYETVTLEWFAKVLKATCQECGSSGVLKRRTYLPDVVLPGMRLIEIKGRFTADDRKTLVGARETNPEYEFYILFQRDNWITKKKVTRYSDWARKNNFVCAIGEEIPDEWLKR